MTSIRTTGLLLAVLLGLGGQPAFADDSLAEGKTTREAAAAEPRVVNINTADAGTLEAVLVGVGRSRAEAIVAFREANGRFYSAEELAAVRGIGESTVQKNQARIVVE